MHTPSSFPTRNSLPVLTSVLTALLICTATFSRGQAPPTTGLKLWLKADADVTASANGAVTAWTDQSGNNNHAAQADESMAPTLVPNALNGKPVLRFDGVDDFLDVAHSASLAITGDLSTFFVVKFDDFATYRAVWGKTVGNLAGSTDFYALPGSGIPRVYRGDGTLDSLGFVAGTRGLRVATYLVVGFDMQGTTLTHYLGGQPNGSGELTATLVDGGTNLKIGTREDFVTRLKGDLAELLIYDQALAEADRTAAFDYLKNKYGMLHVPSVLAEEMITDTNLQRGVNAKGITPTDVVMGPMQFTTNNGTPFWGLAEWWSKQTVYGTTPTVRASGAYRWSNAYKTVTLGPAGTSDSDVILYVDSIAEYGGVFRTSSGVWPHLLVDQKISSPGGGAESFAPWLSDLAELRINIEARLNSAYNYYGSGYNSSLHAAQFVIYFTVQYLQPGQTGYGDYMWFGLNLYDDRYALPGLYQNGDAGTGKYLYNIGLPFNANGMTLGAWKTVSGDLLPYIKAGFTAARNAGFLTYSGNLADYKIGGMNMGWEVPGLSRVEMQTRNFSLMFVVTSVNPNPTNIVWSVKANNTLELNWPGSHLGWYAQSNSVNVANPGFWFDIAGSQNVTNLSLTINPAQSNVFYRLGY